MEADILTERQKACMALVRQGLSSKQIARELGISHRTVDRHVATALERLGAPSRLAAISHFRERTDFEPQPRPNQPALLTTRSIANETYAIAEASRRETQPFLPPLGGTPNGARRSDRINWICWIALLSVMVTCVGRSPFSTEASGAFFDPSNSMTTALSLSITSSVKFTS